MSYGGYGHSNNSGSSWVTIIVGIILLLFLTSATKSCSRSESHMIYLSEGYCYHEDTHIIYIESEVGRYGIEHHMLSIMMRMVKSTNMILILENGFQLINKIIYSLITRR